MTITEQERHWEREKEILIRKQKIKEEKAEIQKKSRLPTQKMALYYIVANCTVIEIYSMIAMWVFRDLSPLCSLIAAVVGECLAYITYCAKSKTENSKDGIVYELAMKDMEQPDPGPKG